MACLVPEGGFPWSRGFSLVQGGFSLPGLGGPPSWQGGLPAWPGGSPWSGGVVCLVPGGVPLPGPRGVLLPGLGGVLPGLVGGFSLPGLRGSSLLAGGSPCLAQGGLPGRGEVVCLVRGGSSFLETPPVNRITHTCKNITLATTLLRPVIKYFYYPNTPKQK